MYPGEKNGKISVEFSSEEMTTLLDILDFVKNNAIEAIEKVPEMILEEKDRIAETEFLKGIAMNTTILTTRLMDRVKVIVEGERILH
jgi:hypothetical protein